MLILTGCGSNNDNPKNLAEEMVKKLSKGDYKNIEKLIYSGEKPIFFTEDIFEKYLKDNDLLIKGNKKVKVIKYEEPDKEDSFCEVVVRIDNNMVIEINAIKKDDKWYVDLSDEFKNEYSFLVPKDSEVYIENIKLNKEKYSQLKEFHYDVSYMHNGTKVYMDKYAFTTFYVDELNLKVQKDGFM